MQLPRLALTQIFHARWRVAILYGAKWPPLATSRVECVRLCTYLFLPQGHAFGRLTLCRSAAWGLSAGPVRPSPICPATNRFC